MRRFLDKLGNTIWLLVAIGFGVVVLIVWLGFFGLGDCEFLEGQEACEERLFFEEEARRDLIDTVPHPSDRR